MYTIKSSSEDTFHSVARNGIKEKQKKDGQEGDDNHLDDGPLVIVPDDVPDRLQRVEEPHERRVRSPARIFLLKAHQQGCQDINDFH